MALKSYAEVQEFISSVMEANKKEGGPPPISPHHAFWKTLTYEQFTQGNVPGVLNPNNMQPIPILDKGNSAASNLILALSGKGLLFDPIVGKIKRMPADGPPFFTDDQIEELADWIDEGCPE